MTEEEKLDEKEDDNWDFDMSIYEQEEPDEYVETIKDKPRAQVTGYRSRFSMGGQEQERIHELRLLASKYAIDVEARTQDMPLLWKYYGVLSEIWEITRNIYGALINDEMNEIRGKCRKLMEDYSTGNIPPKVHNNLLYFRSCIYRIHQISNLSLETEQVHKQSFNRTKRKITE